MDLFFTNTMKIDGIYWNQKVFGRKQKVSSKSRRHRIIRLFTWSSALNSATVIANGGWESEC
jgi:hypothetical protein